jgi:transposase InsO family protein
MSAGIISMTGNKEVMKSMSILERRVQDKIARPSLAKGIAVVARGARRNQKHMSLRKLVGQKVIRRKADKEFSAKVFMKPSKDRTIKLKGREVGFEVVGTILEFGSATQNITPQPFMRPALEQGKGAAVAAIAAEARKRLKRIGAI